MATFLVNAKMAPALAARVEASVTGRKKSAAGAQAKKKRFVALARVAVVLLVVFVVQSVVSFRRRERETLEAARNEALTAFRAHAGGITDRERNAPRRIEALAVKLVSSFDKDFVGPELRSPGALDAVIAKPLLYLRAPLGNFATTKAVAEGAATSPKDALVLCLLDPPSSRAEKDVLTKVRLAYGTGGTVEAKTSHVRHLHEAEVGLPFLAPELGKRIQESEDPNELVKIKRDIDRAPVENGKRAAKSTTLLLAVDEPGEGGPIELDGERRHHVRVALVDLATEKTLLDVRRQVDPAWISAQKRSELARGMDSCLLALDVREATTAR